MRHASLFSGIGGFDLAAEWMGWENVFHCEWNTFGQKVLKYYWPNSECFTDITKSDFTKYANQIDILTGGFPCQPYSMAGKRLGKEDERHLWPEMLRAIREIKPRIVVGENVFGLLSWNGGMVFDEVHTDLEAEGYQVQAVVIPAAAVNAPHGRNRVWFLASNSNCIRLERGLYENGRQRKISTLNASTLNTLFLRSTWSNFPTQPAICGGDDGLPSQLDGITFPKWRSESIKAYGNAIVPQVAFEIFKAIELTLKNG
jgi:DNA (cytosine-5)-methyltransferase 1